MVDTLRGQMRIRAWPRKRGRPKHPFTRLWNDWFRDANALAKRADGHAHAAAIELTKGTGLYPRDIMLRAMSKGLIDFVDENGVLIQNRERRIEPVTFQGAWTRPTANITIGTGAFVAPNWPLPVIDTFGFWSAGQPDRFTIPAGFEIIQLHAAATQSTGAGGRMVAFFEIVGGAPFGGASTENPTTVTIAAASGPIVVQEGDQVRVKFFMQNGGTIGSTGVSFFALTVLQTTE